MSNMCTLAFQVPEELFQKIKDNLQRNNMTQKQFVIGLIETEINRDLTQREVVSETPSNSEEIEERLEEQESAAASDNFDSENEDLDEEQDEAEEMVMSMGM